MTLVKSIDQHASTTIAPRCAGSGLKWTNHSVDVIDTPSTRGMINKVGYLLKVAEPSA